ncbi:MAG: relaxase domain-containing protein [Candidatus Dormibacteraeota bacterium]|nr:relaxase domain-containing protein [Candidatus Dormibacteraeota bacterium]
MAFSHHKISVGGEGQSAGAALSYLADPQAKSADYYSESKRAPMRWAASDRAKAQLGLGDHVELWKVERLLNGLHPYTGDLLRRYGATKTMIGAIDVTESPAPKSVSILWALADFELKKQIEGMVVGAVAGAVGVMTRHVPLVRERYGPGPHDVRAIKANDVVGLQVLHSTARLSESKPGIPDPQLHVHALLFADLREDGKLRAIDSRLILQHQTELDGEAQASLAMELARAGFEIERTPILGPNGKVKRIAWEVKGIPASLIKAMSGRSQEISELTQRYREETGREASGPGWDRYVAGKRGAKAHVEASELAAIWAEEAAKHGLDAEAVQRVVAEAFERAKHWVEPDERSPQAEQLRQEILRDICRDHALVPKRQLDALAQQRAIGLVSPYTAQTVVANLFGDGDLLLTSDDQVTTLEVLAHEQRAERALRRLVQGGPGPSVDQERLDAKLREAEERERPFDPGQREAIALALSGARFVSIAGPAGTGKGYASRAMVDLWHEQGRRAYALAVAGRTTQQAAHDSGAEPLTLDGLHARTSHDTLQLRESDVLLVDEAAMIDHHRYANLLEAAADAGATVVQVGDDKQLNPVGPGGLWTLFHAMAGEQGSATELRQIHRARNPAEAQAWTDMRNGRIEQALSWYRDVGQLHLYQTRPELLQGMVANWWQQDRDNAMIVDTSNAERDSLNRMAQAKRLEAGELGAEPFQLANGREIRAGDRVLFAHEPHHLDPLLNAPGPRIENGTTATVRELIVMPGQSGALEAQAVTLELHEPGGSRQVQVDATADLELGYARHAMKSQGMTVKGSNIGISSQTGQQELYEMTTRTQEGTHIHALRVEVAELGVDPDVLEAPASPHQLPGREVHEVQQRDQEAASEPLPSDPELEPAGVQVNAEPQLAEMTLDRSSRDLDRVRMFNQSELRKDQVVSFGEQLPLREPTGVELGELGVVKSVHQGGINFDYARVQLVGGRIVNVYQTDHVQPAPDITPEAVYGQQPTVSQRNPDASINLPLENGVIVQQGDLVRFPDSQAEGRIVEVSRSPASPSSRGLVELSEGGQRVPLYGASKVEIVKSAQEIAAESVQRAEAAQADAAAVESATIKGIEKQALRSGPKRAVGNAELAPSPEAKATELIARDTRQQGRELDVPEGRQDIRHDEQQLAAPEQTQEPAAPQPEPDVQQTVERAQEAAREAARPEPQPSPEHEQQVAETHRQLQQQAADRSAGHPTPSRSPEVEAQPEAATPTPEMAR